MQSIIMEFQPLTFNSHRLTIPLTLLFHLFLIIIITIIRLFYGNLYNPHSLSLSYCIKASIISP